MPAWKVLFTVVFALTCLGLAFATFVVYHPALHGEFIWDDQPGHVTKPELQSLAGLGRIWFELGATQQYYPILHSAFWLEHRLWGDAVLGYHIVNVLLHATAATLFGLILRRLNVRGATFAAWIFARRQRHRFATLAADASFRAHRRSRSSS